MSEKGIRLDQLLVERGLALSRSKAQAHIMAGEVYVDGARVEKPGKIIAAGAELEIRSKSPAYVSRGGTKLAGALDALSLEVGGMTALDVGSSTGGFSDCLLHRGVKRIYAVDVGRGQLDWRLRNDERVIVMEGINARYLKPEDLPEKVDLVTIDVSFISLKKIIPSVVSFLEKDGILLPMVKPQFEVGREQVGKGGVVKDPALHCDVLRDIAAFLYNAGLEVKGIQSSPIMGPKGNREFFILSINAGPTSDPEALETLVQKAVYEKD